MRNVLAYVDERVESERALELAVEVAHRWQGSVTALSVVEPAALAFDEAGASLAVGGLAKALLAAHEERLTAMVERMRRDPVEISTESAIGTAWLEVTRRAVRNSSDLVVKVARGRRRLGWPLFGSTALHLLRKCPAAVWLVEPRGSIVPRRILVALDPDPGSPSLNRFEAQVLAHAHALAERFGADLEIVCCWQLVAEDLLAGRLEPLRMLQVMDGMRDAMHAALDSLLEPYAGRIDERHVHLEKGAFAHVTASFAEEQAIDLVVVGTISPDADVGMLIREEVEDLVQRLPCSVLAVKPAGFRTPIRLDDG